MCVLCVIVGAMVRRARGVQYLLRWVWGEVRCLFGMFEYLVLTRAIAGTHVCDYGIIWRRIVLGAELRRRGAMAFQGGGH